MNILTILTNKGHNFSRIGVTFVTLGRVAAKQRSGTAKPTETFVTSLAQTLTTRKTNHQCKSETINHQLWMNISSPMFYV